MTRKKKYKETTPDIIKVNPKTEGQRLLIESIEKNPITIASGPSGSGKTLVALHEAVQMFHKRQIDKILYIKPNVDIFYDKGIGYLSGDIDEKLSPLLAPVRDNLSVFCSDGKARQMIDNKDIEIQLIEFLRGRSLGYTFVILDESQNMHPAGILLALSRLEETSKIVLLGDAAQKDSYSRLGNGINDAIQRLSPLKDTVGIIQFTEEDILRNSYLKDVIKAYGDVWHFSIIKI